MLMFSASIGHGDPSTSFWHLWSMQTEAEDIQET